MIRSFVRRFLYPLHERLRGRPTLRLLRRFRATETMSPDEVGTLRDDAVAKLVRHAASQVPWWRDWFATNDIDPQSIDGTEALRRLPTMDKDFIRIHLERLHAEDHAGRLIRLATGGSSGRPLIFYSDKVRESSQLAAKFRCREWWGIEVGDQQVDLWGAPIEIDAQDRFRIFKDRLLNFRMLSAFELSDEKMAGFRRELKRPRADFLYGYASVLDRYAAFLEARGESLRDLRLKGAVSTAELLFPRQRERIERVFGCPVINEYGCRDGGYVAQECREKRLHIAADTVHVEILRDGEPVPVGEEGEIAVTNLWSFGMPLIRYRLGDRARLDPSSCPCGRSLPLLGELTGRVTDTLVMPDGNRVHGLGLMYVVRDLEGVSVFQVIQDAVDHVDVLVVPTANADRAMLERRVTEGTRETLGPSMRVDVRLVETIPPAASGKMRSVWNQIENPEA